MARSAGTRKCPELFRFVVIGAVLATTTAAQAEPLTLSGGLTNRFTDNVERAPFNETSDIESRINLTLTHQTDPGQCEASTAANVGYGVWWDETFDPEDYASLDFAGACELARGLSWELSDNLRDVTQSRRASDTPDNRTRKNVFRTGPVYSLMVTPQDQLRFSANYERTDFSEPEETDSDRYIGTASWNHSFDPTLSSGLQFRTNQTELDTGAEIDIDTASVLFAKSWEATSLSGSIGVSEIESRFRDITQTSDGVVGDFSLERDISPVAQIYVRGSREFTDQTSDFDIRFGEFVFDLRETSEVEVTALDAGMSRQFSDGSLLNAGLYANRSDFIRADEVEDSIGLTARFSRPLTALASLQAGARYEHSTFEEDDSTDDTYSFDVGLNYELTRDLDVNGRVGHTTRDSDLNTSEYRENWVSLGLDYQFF